MRRLRAKAGLTREALAHGCGINRTYLSSVERSERNVSIDNIGRIAKGLGTGSVSMSVRSWSRAATFLPIGSRRSTGIEL
ncbi:MAG: helix-turn-helix transcriptional regulator [Alphaproteobacteria bacterium]|nr:MAG: helix-turn-helix transcriptional regulator [Alphaproteobacteria bacterium]